MTAAEWARRQHLAQPCQPARPTSCRYCWEATYDIRPITEAMVAAGALPRTYDTALPQGWVDAVHVETGVWPQTLGFVWAYPDAGRGHIFGLPVPLTAWARTFYEALPEALR